MRKLANLAAMVLLLGCPPALGFDFARYQATDLDALMAQARPQRVLDRGQQQFDRIRIVLGSTSWDHTAMRLRNGGFSSGS
jgi:hypothetical protein